MVVLENRKSNGKPGGWGKIEGGNTDYRRFFFQTRVFFRKKSTGVACKGEVWGRNFGVQEYMEDLEYMN